MRPILENHRGPFALQGETPGGKHGSRNVAIPGLHSAEEAHEEARMLVNDPRETYRRVYVFSDFEQQYTGAVYERGKDYEPWHACPTRSEWLKAHGWRAGGLGVGVGSEEGALLSRFDGLVRPVEVADGCELLPDADDGSSVQGVQPEIEITIDGTLPAGAVQAIADEIVQAAKRPEPWATPAKRGTISAPAYAAKVHGKRTATVYQAIDPTDEPTRIAAEKVQGNPRTALEAMSRRRVFTLADILEDVGTQLSAAGVEHPDRFIGAYASRFKAANLIKVKEKE